jgi:hypothetical protein
MSSAKRLRLSTNADYVAAAKASAAELEADVDAIPSSQSQVTQHLPNKALVVAEDKASTHDIDSLPASSSLALPAATQTGTDAGYAMHCDAHLLQSRVAF